MGGVNTSAAGTSLAQTKGSDVQRNQQDSSAQQRRVFGDTHADAAAGVGETDGEDHETADRDADGRRVLERPARAKAGDAAADETVEDAPRIKDLSGQSGNQLDLSG
jgi:hypothetical protein